MTTHFSSLAHFGLSKCASSCFSCPFGFPNVRLSVFPQNFRPTFAHIFDKMQTLNMNDHQMLGGQPVQHLLQDFSPIMQQNDQDTLVARGQPEAQTQPMSQAEVVVSSSDNLFHPPLNDSAYVF